MAFENTLDSPDYMALLGTANYAVDSSIALPGILERERRIFENLFYERLLAMNEGRGIAEDSSTQWLLGQRSRLEMFLPRGLVADSLEVELARQRQGFLHFWVWMAKHPARSGQWANTFKILQQAGYQPLDGFHVDQLKWDSNRIRYGLGIALASLEDSHQKSMDPTWNYRLTHNTLGGKPSFLFAGHSGRIPLKGEDWVLDLPARGNPAPTGR